ncbi:MAG: tetratricopeptide repeat protein, partial [Candidatus Poseidoniales archaeon]
VSDAVAESMAAALRSAGLGDMVEHVEVKSMGYSENVLERIIEEHSISDREGFLTFAHSMDADDNNYLREDELLAAAKKWTAERNPTPKVEEDSNDENSVDFLLQLGEECSRKNDSKGALIAFNKAIALDPSCDMAWFNRGVLLEAEQDARGARQAFQICLDINPDNAPATANIATLLERIGDDAAAYEMAVRALNFFPGHPLLLDVKNRCAESGENLPIEAMPIQSPSQTYDDKHVTDVMKEVGVTDKEAILAEAVHHDDDQNQHLEYQELKSAAEVVAATQEIQEATAMVVEPVIQQPPQIIEEPIPKPIDMDDLVLEATAMIRSGDAQGALGLLSPHLKTIAAEHAGAWRIAGGAMARLELDDHAISALEHAQLLDPNQGSGWFNLGSIYQRKGESPRAIECYMEAMNVQSDYLKAALKCSQLCNQTGDVENYLHSTRTLLQIEPLNPAREEFIRILIELAEGEATVLESVHGIPPTLPEGPHLAQEALGYLGDGETEYHARAYTAAKNDVQAVTIWKSMIKLDGQNPSIWRGLARSLESAGDLETAQKCHRKADELSGVAPVQAVAPAPAPAFAPAAPMEQATVEPVTPQPMAVPVDHQESQADYYMNALGLQTPPEPQNLEVVQPTAEAAQSLLVDSAQALNERPQSIELVEAELPTQPAFDLTQAAIEAQQLASATVDTEVNSSSVANQDVAWYNQGVALIEGGKFREALSSFDRALPSFAGDDGMIIRILNGRGNAYYYLEEYPKCVEAYHQAMLIRPSEVRGKTLYNMGSAYAEMERYPDAMKCFEQSIPRGLESEEIKRAKEQIRRCGILLKEVERKNKRR